MDGPDDDPAVDMAAFSKFVALKAVISTFDELLNSCLHTLPGGDGTVCKICLAKECGPHCVRVRAERAMDFLTKGDTGGPPHGS